MNDERLKKLHQHLNGMMEESPLGIRSDIDALFDCGLQAFRAEMREMTDFSEAPAVKEKYLDYFRRVTEYAMRSIESHL
jgi:hypothetical protein